MDDAFEKWLISVEFRLGCEALDKYRELKPKLQEQARADERAKCYNEMSKGNKAVTEWGLAQYKKGQADLIEQLALDGQYGIVAVIKQYMASESLGSDVLSPPMPGGTPKPENAASFPKEAAARKGDKR